MPSPSLYMIGEVSLAFSSLAKPLLGITPAPCMVRGSLASERPPDSTCTHGLGGILKDIEANKTTFRRMSCTNRLFCSLLEGAVPHDPEEQGSRGVQERCGSDPANKAMERNVDDRRGWTFLPRKEDLREVNEWALIQQKVQHVLFDAWTTEWTGTTTLRAVIASVKHQGKEENCHWASSSGLTHTIAREWHCRQIRRTLPQT